MITTFLVKLIQNCNKKHRLVMSMFYFLLFFTQNTNNSLTNVNLTSIIQNRNVKIWGENVMGVTIKEIADRAGVSIATVSHVINKTRYVSPELCKKVEELIVETGYINKINDKEMKMLVGKKSIIGIIVPALVSSIYSNFIEDLREIFSALGYIVAVYVTDDDLSYESSLIQGVITNKRIVGMIICPVSSDSKNYEKLKRAGIPFVCLDRVFEDYSVSCITSENVRGIYDGVSHLINRGHTSIGVLVSSNTSEPMRERLEGYKVAMHENGLQFDEKLVLNYDVLRDNSKFDALFHDYYEKYRPTAIISCGNRLTALLLHAMKNTGLNYPKDISVIGFGDDQWCKLVNPSLTTLIQDIKSISRSCADELLKAIDGINEPQFVACPMKLKMGESVSTLVRGPLGEVTTNYEDIPITAKETKMIREKDFKAALSFHYGNNSWTYLHHKGIRDTFEYFDIKIMAVTNADFDADLQSTQINSIMLQKPDIIAAVPTEDEKNCELFKKVGKKTKLVFMSHIPNGISSSDYCSCVSINEVEHGVMAANLMGEYYQNEANVKAGFIIHGSDFYATQTRDSSAEQIIRQHYKNIEIVEKAGFVKINRAYNVCMDMLKRNSDIKTLYVSWDVPALEVIRALKELRREDVTIFTCDLGHEIGKYLASGRMVKGISAQQPYEQGVAVARAMIKALVNDESIKYVIVPPIAVKQENLLATWKKILKEDAPMGIERALQDGIV